MLNVLLVGFTCLLMTCHAQWAGQYLAAENCVKFIVVLVLVNFVVFQGVFWRVKFVEIGCQNNAQNNPHDNKHGSVRNTSK